MCKRMGGGVLPELVSRRGLHCSQGDFSGRRDGVFGPCSDNRMCALHLKLRERSSWEWVIAPAEDESSGTTASSLFALSTSTSH